MIKHGFGLALLGLAGSVVASGGESSKWKIEVGPPTPNTIFIQDEKKDEKKKDQRPNWGLSVGAYFPADEELRDLFGDTLLRFGISPISRKFDKRWDISTDVNVLWASDNGARLLIIPFTVGGLVGFGEGDTKGYVAVNAGPAFISYKLFRVVDVKGGDGEEIEERKDTKLGWNANIEGGVLINDRLSLTGRYDWFGKHDGFDFGGFSINLNYAFFRW